MLGWCPHLGLDGNRHEMFLVSSPRHRCYARHRCERIGSAYQAQICLTTAYRRCSRLAAVFADDEPQASPADSPTGVEDSSRLVQPAARYTDLQMVASAKKSKPRRPLTLVELVVLGLAVAIVLAVFFIGYSIVHRLWFGHGMEAAPVVAEDPELAATGMLSTVVPSLTPTASPSPVAPTITPGPPTPIPEPTLPTSTPIVRLPADSPPTRLVIPKIGLDVPVLSVGVKTVHEGGEPKLVWADVPNAAGFHQTSAYPGNPGNTVLNGHRDIQGAIFRHLDRLEPGDEIILYVDDLAYPYLVTETLVVPETFASADQRAENLRLIGYMPEERLTLVTCTPVGLATKRLLVIARPPEQVMPQMPEAGTGTGP